MVLLSSQLEESVRNPSTPGRLAFTLTSPAPEKFLAVALTEKTQIIFFWGTKPCPQKHQNVSFFITHLLLQIDYRKMLP